MEDEEIVACVEAAAGQSLEGARIEPLGGKQGLLVCRVRAPGGGRFVFKAVRESGRREVVLTAWLSRAHPGIVPEVLACEEDARRGLYWMVTRDVGERRLADVPTVEGYMSAAQSLARIQAAALDSEEAFCRMGIPRVGPAQWEEVALRVLEALDRAEHPLWRGCRPELERAAWATSEVAQDTVSLPTALVHGDLHAGNIAISEGESPALYLLDWGSAYVGAALLGLEELLWPAARYLRGQEDLHRVRAVYFREWTSYLGKPGRWEKAMAACRALIHLELLDENLNRPAMLGPDADFATATALRRYLETYRAWERL